MSAPASPDIRNYTIGKGFATFQRNGAGPFVDLGNITQFEFTPSLEKLDHFSTRGGVKQKDRSVVTSQSGQLVITMEEFTLQNLSIALLGLTDTDSAGRDTVAIMSEATVKGAIKFTATNDVGQKWDWSFPNVEFSPSSGISPLSDEWGNMEITGEVLKETGQNRFGTITYMGGEGDTEDSESS